jgi:protoheme IX farnesyltransferase
MSKIKLYYELMKPGIIYGNALTAVAGFFLAAQGTISVLLLAETLAGISLVIASACIFNNYIDRDIDIKMERTKNRALAIRSISPFRALTFATVLGVLGALILLVHTNVLTFAIALSGFFIYVVVYGFAKRHSPLGVHVGALAGAVPPLVGYTAVTNTIDATGLTLFMVLVVWQMPHFFSIAIYRQEEYKAAGIYVLPLRLGAFRTKLLITIYVAVFAFAALVLGLVGPVSVAYQIAMAIVCMGWFALSLMGFLKNDEAHDRTWARRMFFYSLIVITLFSLVLIV